MKTKFVVLLGAVSVSAMLLTHASQVNRRCSAPSLRPASTVADGLPLPSPKPPKAATIELADGLPLPSPKPPKSVVKSTVLVADGSPLPSPKPPKSA